MTEEPDRPGAPRPSVPPTPTRLVRRGRRTVLLLVVAVALAVVSALFLVDDGTELSGNEALLSGRVVDAQTRKPLPGARLLIDQEGVA